MNAERSRGGTETRDNRENREVCEKRLEGWVRAYGTAILRTCFVCLSDRQAAEDAMQETFLKAWKAMDSFQGRNGAGEKTWLMHIAMNVCRDMQRTRWFRHIDMRRALEDIPQGVASVLPEDRSLLMDIMSLPDKYKQPIMLYYYQDMTIEETAEVLCISKSTVHSRLRKAEGMLRLALKGGDCYV
ncbi:MAG: sigma-70 family RNA polymerase sigma factor [Clostridia bacterium]|nr:sigma-70 family RNA polymerase sigma factor [Clostridia bacterium]